MISGCHLGVPMKVMAACLGQPPLRELAVLRPGGKPPEPSPMAAPGAFARHRCPLNLGTHLAAQQHANSLVCLLQRGWPRVGGGALPVAGGWRGHSQSSHGPHRTNPKRSDGAVHRHGFRRQYMCTTPRFLLSSSSSCLQGCEKNSRPRNGERKSGRQAERSQEETATEQRHWAAGTGEDGRKGTGCQRLCSTQMC